MLKQSGQRATKVYSLLSALFRLRKRAAFSEIKLRFELHKHNAQTRGLVKFSNFVDRAAMKRKADSFAVIKKNFHNENPWLKHSIDKFTAFAGCCEQVTFWKMRLLKNLGEDNVSAEKSIRLRKRLKSWRSEDYSP